MGKTGKEAISIDGLAQRPIANVSIVDLVVGKGGGGAKLAHWATAHACVCVRGLGASQSTHGTRRPAPPRISGVANLRCDGVVVGGKAVTCAAHAAALPSR